MSSNNFHATAICSSCHQPGHATRNNRRCPNYRRTHRNVPEETHTTQANMHQRRPCECGVVFVPYTCKYTSKLKVGINFIINKHISLS